MNSQKPTWPLQKRIYRLDFKKANKLRLRKSLDAPIFGAGGLLVLILIVCLFTKPELIVPIVTKGWWLFVILGAFMMVTSYMQLSNLEATKYIILQNAIVRTLDDRYMNDITMHNVQRAEIFTGFKKNLVVPFENISKVKFKRNEIIVYVSGSNFLSANSRMDVPKELKDFEDFKHSIELIIANNPHIKVL